MGSRPSSQLFRVDLLTFEDDEPAHEMKNSELHADC